VGGGERWYLPIGVTISRFSSFWRSILVLTGNYLE